ncbi:MAG: WD40 repeat domain-containing protein [bacterium]
MKFISSVVMLISAYCLSNMDAYAVTPVRVFSPPMFDTNGDTEDRVYQLSFSVSSSDWMEMIYYSGSAVFGYDLTIVVPGLHHHVQWNVKTLATGDVETGVGAVYSNLIPSATSSVYVNDQWLPLEHAYHLPEYEDENWYELKFATQSPDGKSIGGAVLFTSGGGIMMQQKRSSLSLWDAADGHLIYQEKVESDNNPFSHSPFYIKYSPTGRFLLLRSMIDIAEYSPTGSPGDVAIPDADLLDIEQKILRKADRDVAFSSDDRYLLTVRDGQPTLVDADTDKNLCIYEMPSPMLSAVFSPDDSEIYIAGEDCKIYVFDSGIFSHARNWFLYEGVYGKENFE